MTTSKLPDWAESIRRKYVGGESSMFILHLNVFDRFLHDGQWYSLTDFLGRVLLADNKQTILVYDPASGVSFLKESEVTKRIPELRLKRAPKDVLPLIETVLDVSDSVAVIITYAGAFIPDAEAHFLSEQDRINVVTLHRWSLSAKMAQKDQVVFLQTELLQGLNRQLVDNPMISAVEIPLPDQETRASVVRKTDPSIGPTHVERLARHTAGLRSVQIASILKPREGGGLDGQTHKAFIRELLGDSPDAAERTEKLAALTRGMSPEEIRHLINPELPLPEGDRPDAFTDVIELIHQRKREIIEKECAGLIEFVDARHDLSVVGGQESIKDELRQIARNIKAGDRVRVPMGLLFVGPMGSGKTFVASAFVKESGLTAVTLKNFRSKWVGSTEANLEKVLRIVKSLGPIVLIIDEGDRAFGGSGAEDGGTSSRVIGRIKEFMSDPDNRGRVLFILMTNRPDKLDVDIKRAGRLDRKIPFFYPERSEDVEGVLGALFRRHGIRTDLDWERDRERTSARLVGYSNADLEAVVLLANEMAQDEHGMVTAELVARAAEDYMPPRDTDMLEYMELLAVFETSRRMMLPERYQGLSPEDLNERLRHKRVLLGI